MGEVNRPCNENDNDEAVESASHPPLIDISRPASRFSAPRCRRCISISVCVVMSRNQMNVECDASRRK